MSKRSTTGSDHTLAVIFLIIEIGAVFACLLFGAYVVYARQVQAQQFAATAAAAVPIPSPTFPTLPPTPLPTLSPTPSPIPTSTPTRTATPTLSPTPRPPTALPPTQAPPTPIPPTAPPPLTELPGQASVSGVPGHGRRLNLDCEARTAVDWAAFFGFTIDELEFQSRLPTSLNPEEGFVGDPSDKAGYIPPKSYGVHANPVANLLRQYGVRAYAWKNLSWHDLQAEIASGHPVIVWVVGDVRPGVPVPYVAPNGQVVTVAQYEHTVILTGYDEEKVQIVDGRGRYKRDIDRFLDSWSVLGYMAIIANEKPIR